MAAEWVGLEQVGIFQTKYSHSGPPGLSPCSTLKNCCRCWKAGHVRGSGLCPACHSHICWLKDPTQPFLPWSFSQGLKVVRKTPGFGQDL